MALDVLRGRWLLSPCCVCLFLALSCFSPAGLRADEVPNPRTIEAGRSTIGSALSPDGKLVAVPAQPSGNDGGSAVLRIWDTQSGGLVQSLTAQARGVRSCLFAPDGGLLACEAGNGTVQLWRVGDWTLQQTLKPSALRPREQSRGLAFSPDGTLLTEVFLAEPAQSWQSKLLVWDVAGGQIFRTFPIEQPWWTSDVMSFAPGGQTLLLGVTDDTKETVNNRFTRHASVEFRDVRSGRVLRRLPVEGDANIAAFSPSGELVAIRRYLKAWSGETVELRNCSTGYLVKSCNMPGHHVSRLQFSPSDNTITFGIEDGSVAVWNIDSQPQPTILAGGHCREVDFTAANAAGDLVASGGDGIVRIWNLRHGIPTLPPVQTLPLRLFDPQQMIVAGNMVQTLLAPSGRLKVLRDAHTMIERYNLATRERTEIQLTYDRIARREWMSPNGKWLAMELQRGADTATDTVVWEVDQHKIIFTLPEAAGSALAMTFSPDGSRIASITSSGAVRIYDAAKGRKLAEWEFRIEGAPTVSMAFSPDDALLAIGDYRGTIQLFNTATGHLQSTIQADGNVVSLQFSTDGAMLASGHTFAVDDWEAHKTTTVNLWEVRTGALHWGISESGRQLGSLAFSPDNKMLLISVMDTQAEGVLGSVLLLDEERGLKVKEFADPCGGGKACYAGDGTQIVTSSYSGVVKLWDLSSKPQSAP